MSKRLVLDFVVKRAYDRVTLVLESLKDEACKSEQNDYKLVGNALHHARLQKHGFKISYLSPHKTQSHDSLAII